MNFNHLSSVAGFANEVTVDMQSGIDGSVIEESEVETGTAMTTVAALRLRFAARETKDPDCRSATGVAWGCDFNLLIRPSGTQKVIK